MAEYAISFARSARKELEALPNAFIERIFRKIETLSDVPRPSGCRKLQGSDDVWRIRIGDYRVIYAVDDQSRTVDVVAVRHRSQAYD
jgi:mRNA interferase RelE/StbE